MSMWLCAKTVITKGLTKNIHVCNSMRVAHGESTCTNCCVIKQEDLEIVCDIMVNGMPRIDQLV
jgi:hypothetical protein